VDGAMFQGAPLRIIRGQVIDTPDENIKYDLVLPGNWEVVYGKKC